MSVDAQVQNAAGADPGLIVAVGAFPAGVTDPTLDVRAVRPDQEPKLVEPGTKHMAADGVITVTPPPPPPIVFSQDAMLEGQVRTTDATPAEVVRLSLSVQTGYTGQVNILGVDATNGAVRVIRASVAVKRLNAAAVSVGSPVVLASHADTGTTAWAIAQSVQGNDVVVTVTGAAGRTVDWYCRGAVMSFAPGGVG